MASASLSRVSVLNIKPPALRVVLLSLILASITKREWRSTSNTIYEFLEPCIKPLSH